jgi:hypothetical protein
MPEINLLISPTLTTIDALTLDASISEQHTSEVEVTEHPVEAGANIADHARVKPAVLTIEGLVSDTPINRSQVRRIVESLGVSFESLSLEDVLAGQPGYAQQAFGVLETMRDTAKLVQIVTGLKTYEDMILTSLSVPRNAQSGDALRFTATFKHVRLVTNQTTTATVTKTPGGKKKASAGKQASSEAADSASKRKSVAKKLSDGSGASALLGLP